MTEPKNPKMTKQPEKPEEIAKGVEPIDLTSSDDFVTLEEIENLKDFEIRDTDLATINRKDPLTIIDKPSDPHLGHLVFRWLNPSHRHKVGMQGWRWVTGELARLCRAKKVAVEYVGGGSATSVLVNGDLQLAFMPRPLYEHFKREKALKATAEMQDITDQVQLKSEVNSEYVDVDPEVKIKRTFEGMEVKDG